MKKALLRAVLSIMVISLSITAVFGASKAKPIKKISNVDISIVFSPKADNGNGAVVVTPKFKNNHKGITRLLYFRNINNKKFKKLATLKKDKPIEININNLNKKGGKYQFKVVSYLKGKFAKTKNGRYYTFSKDGKSVKVKNNKFYRSGKKLFKNKKKTRWSRISYLKYRTRIYGNTITKKFILNPILSENDIQESETKELLYYRPYKLVKPINVAEYKYYPKEELTSVQAIATLGNFNEIKNGWNDIKKKYNLPNNFNAAYVEPYFTPEIKVPASQIVSDKTQSLMGEVKTLKQAPKLPLYNKEIVNMIKPVNISDYIEEKNIIVSSHKGVFNSFEELKSFSGQTVNPPFVYDGVTFNKIKKGDNTVLIAKIDPSNAELVAKYGLNINNEKHYEAKTAIRVHEPNNAIVTKTHDRTALKLHINEKTNIVGNLTVAKYVYLDDSVVKDVKSEIKKEQKENISWDKTRKYDDKLDSDRKVLNEGSQKSTKSKITTTYYYGPKEPLIKEEIIEAGVPLEVQRGAIKSVKTVMFEPRATVYPDYGMPLRSDVSAAYLTGDEPIKGKKKVTSYVKESKFKTEEIILKEGRGPVCLSKGLYGKKDGEMKTMEHRLAWAINTARKKAGSKPLRYVIQPYTARLNYDDGSVGHPFNAGYSTCAGYSSSSDGCLLITAPTHPRFSLAHYNLVVKTSPKGVKKVKNKNTQIWEEKEVLLVVSSYWDASKKRYYFHVGFESTDKGANQAEIVELTRRDDGNNYNGSAVIKMMPVNKVYWGNNIKDFDKVNLGYQDDLADGWKPVVSSVDFAHCMNFLDISNPNIISWDFYHSDKSILNSN